MLAAQFLAGPAVHARPVKAKPPPAASPLPVRETSFAADVCRLIENRSRWRGINPHFIARLIHTESRFSPNAISPAGAQGIAQFIPSTARLRNLANPFDPATALTASIDYLAELTATFGNLGLAAVAYNAGEGIARRFVAGGGIPWETENYVITITGRPAEQWREAAARHPIPPIHDAARFADACPDHSLPVPAGCASPRPRSASASPGGSRWRTSLARRRIRIYQRLQRNFPSEAASRPPMLIQVRNRSMGTRLRHAALIGADSQAEALRICQSLQARAMACIVRKTP